MPRVLPYPDLSQPEHVVGMKLTVIHPPDDWVHPADRSAGTWIHGDWSNEHTRVAMWMLRGVPQKHVRLWFGPEMKRRGLTDEEASIEWGKVVELAYLIWVGVWELPWELPVRVHESFTTIVAPLKRAVELDPAKTLTAKHEALYKNAVCDAVRRGAREIYLETVQNIFYEKHIDYKLPRLSSDDWPLAWAAGWDSYAVMPEYPMDAVPEIRVLQLVHPDTSTRQATDLLLTWQAPQELSGVRRRRWQTQKNAAHHWRRDGLFDDGAYPWSEPWGWYRSVTLGNGCPKGYAGRVLPTFWTAGRSGPDR